MKKECWSEEYYIGAVNAAKSELAELEKVFNTHYRLTGRLLQWEMLIDDYKLIRQERDKLREDVCRLNELLRRETGWGQGEIDAAAYPESEVDENDGK